MATKNPSTSSAAAASTADDNGKISADPFALTGIGCSATLGVGVFLIIGYVAGSVAGPATIVSIVIAAATAALSGKGNGGDIRILFFSHTANKNKIIVIKRSFLCGTRPSVVGEASVNVHVCFRVYGTFCGLPRWVDIVAGICYRCGGRCERNQPSFGRTTQRCCSASTAGIGADRLVGHVTVF